MNKNIKLDILTADTILINGSIYTVNKTQLLRMT